jgi:hypothetical protein
VELINRTALVAAANFSEGHAQSRERYLMVTAKATFTFDRRGHVQLETQKPEPLYRAPVATAHGLLPNDLLPRASTDFEVILLGTAYSESGKPVPHRRVALGVGSVRREMDVFGDRVWSGDSFSAPEPFSTMPLSYERAFGGSFDVLIDEHSRLRVVDPINSLGRGFDIDTYMKHLAAELKAPPGYPQLPNHVDRLPNLEHPDAPIRTRADAPAPVGWGTLPHDSGLKVKWALDRVAAEQPIEQDEIIDRAYLQAHPDWVIPVPPTAALVELQGVVPWGSLVFRLPRLRPVIDIHNGGATQARPLAPQMLVLLPDELRFCVLYRATVALEFQPGDDRGLRLRTEERWCDDDELPDLPQPDIQLTATSAEVTSS